MELFLIYLVTRLTELKSGLDSIILVSGALLCAALAFRLLNEFLTDAKVKDTLAAEAESNSDVFLYQGVRRTSRRGLMLFTPVFVVAVFFNMLLPTTRDAIVIAGGYGLVEAVKNERVQRLFSKSAQVASQWLDEQLNGPPSKDAASTKAAPASAPASSSPAQ